MKIPVAVIADLDIITDPGRLHKVLEVMTTPDLASSIADGARAVIDAIKKLPPTVEISEVRQDLARLVPDGATWRDEQDIDLRKELVRLSQRLDRMRRLKRGGLSALSAVIADPLRRLLESLNEIGVFLVPVGELEEWLADANIQESKENKWGWANAAALHVQSRGDTSGDIWDFIRGVGTYLSRR